MQCFRHPARGGDLWLKDLNVTSYLVVNEKASLLGGWRDLLQGSSGSSAPASKRTLKLAEVAGIWKPLTGTTPMVPSSSEGGGAA